MWRITAFGSDGKAIKTVELATGELTIGREGNHGLLLPSGSVSRRHAKFYIQGGRLYVQDEGSANGVFVDGNKIGGPTALTIASAVSIAEFRIGIEVASAGPQFRLVGEGGAYDGRIFELGAGAATVGRATDNELSFDDASLSRKHARVHRNGNRLEIEDLGSSNGTYVNGHRLTARVALSPGDLVRFGEVQFRVQAIEADGTRLVEPIPMAGGGGGGVAGIVVGSLLTLVLIGLAVAALMREPPTVKASGADAIARLLAKGEEHAKTGKQLYKERKYPEAKIELDIALEHDPANVELLRLRNLASRAPQDESNLSAANAKLAMGDRRGYEGALALLQEITPGSVPHDQLVAKLESNLEKYGYESCDKRQYQDCAWALCKLSDLHHGKLNATANKKLDEAEHKLEKDKSYTPCKR